MNGKEDSVNISLCIRFLDGRQGETNARYEFSIGWKLKLRKSAPNWVEGGFWRASVDWTMGVSGFQVRKGACVVDLLFKIFSNRHNTI